MAISSKGAREFGDGHTDVYTYNFRMDDPFGPTQVVPERKNRILLLLTAGKSFAGMPTDRNAIWVGGPPGIGMLFEVDLGAVVGGLYIKPIILKVEQWHDFLEGPIWWDQRNFSSVSFFIVEVVCPCGLSI